MELPEKAMLRSYHALDYGWTPLSRNPCWLSNVSHSSDVYMKRNRFALFQRLVQSLKMLPTNFKLLRLGGKSIVDDFVGSGYCKCESSLWATIHWDLSRVLRFVLPWNFEIFELVLAWCGDTRVRWYSCDCVCMDRCGSVLAQFAWSLLQGCPARESVFQD